ncbi:MAG: ABC transporter permease [Gammaproteobacteria bacterium]|nr:ABC transporter permease [Gammaproteobacteria bacterium]
MNFRIETTTSGTLKFIFSGRLDSNTVAKLWQTCLAALTKYRPKILVLELKEVSYCDGAGIALILMLNKQQLKANKVCEINNLKSDFKKLLDYIERQTEEATTQEIATESLPQHLGHVAVDTIKDFRDNIIFLGSLSYHLFTILLNPKKLRWRDYWRIVEDTGPRAFPIIALIGFLIGLISTFQAAPSFKEFGVQIYLVNLVGLGLVREMGPLLTSVLLSGRTASSFAAEIGTMKINEEINALNTMGLDPVRFLVVPRILATMTVTVILEAFMILFGLIGCYVVMTTLGYTFHAVINQLHQAIDTKDCIGGIIKVFFFGIVIAGVGCLHGLKTRFGAQAVGRSTTQAVVSSLIMLVIVDGIFAVIYYVLGV